MQGREIVLLQFTQLLNLFYSYREATPRDLSMFSKALDSLVTDAEQVGLFRKDLYDFMLGTWLIKRQAEAKAKIVTERLKPCFQN